MDFLGEKAELNLLSTPYQQLRQSLLPEADSRGATQVPIFQGRIQYEAQNCLFCLGSTVAKVPALFFPGPGAALHDKTISKAQWHATRRRRHYTFDILFTFIKKTINKTHAKFTTFSLLSFVSIFTYFLLQALFQITPIIIIIHKIYGAAPTLAHAITNTIYIFCFECFSQNEHVYLSPCLCETKLFIIHYHNLQSVYPFFLPCSHIFFDDYLVILKCFKQDTQKYQY